MKSNFPSMMCAALVCSILHINTVYSQNSNLEEKAMAKVRQLEEVKSFMATAKANNPTLLIGTSPENPFKYYWIQVGLNNQEQIRTAYHLYVDPKTLKVFYVDFMVSDGKKGMEIITLAQWRHFRQYPAFNKMHYYRNGKIIASGK
jgi:hypothetical protein